MQRGVEARGDNLGWLTVANRGKGGSEVVVHLSFGERSVELEMQERAPEGHDPLAEDISATLESIRRQIEEGSGKVETHPRQLLRASGRETAILQTRYVREIRF